MEERNYEELSEVMKENVKRACTGLYEVGTPISKIAHFLGYPESTVRNIIRENK